MRRAMLARAWRISPAELRRCTQEDLDAMAVVLTLEMEARNRGG